MQPEWSARISWADLPANVRSGIEQILHAPVVEAHGQRGGFSPGTADRVRTSTGARAFVKAVGRELNEDSPAIHRKEAAITAALPGTVPAPSLIGTFDDGDWVALVLSDVEGRHPHVPWTRKELTLVLDALFQLSRTPVPPSLEHLPSLEDELREPFKGWSRIRTEPPPAIDPWILQNLDVLEGLADRGLKDLPGTTLVHTDVRADNVMITTGGTAVLVDWPWACIGSSWVDALCVLLNVRVFDPVFDVDSILDSHEVFAPADAGSITGLLSGFGAYFIDAARQQPVPGLPTLRTFQRQQGEAATSWLRSRLQSQ
ncbi:phosphotransferase [Arthrobacter sp. GN70]|nr:phosphotransferase [Arthrobacter sp. GN70]